MFIIFTLIQYFEIINKILNNKMQRNIFRFIQGQLNIQPLKRTSNAIIDKQLRKKQHQLSNFQLLSLYREIIRVSNRPLYNVKNKNNRYGNGNAEEEQQQENNIIKNQQYVFEKKVFASLQQIVFKNRLKNQSQSTQVDPTALYYYRLLSAIKFKLPFQHIIQPFKQHFFLHDFGNTILNYLSILLVPCVNHKKQIEQVASFILIVLKQQLPNINFKQYFYIKYVLQNSQYFVENSLKTQLDELIDENILFYDYQDLAKFMSLKNKTFKTIRRFAFIQKSQIYQKVSYSYLQKLKKQQSSQNLKQVFSQSDMIPGDILGEDNIQKALYYNKKFYSNLGDLQLFQDLISSQNSTLPNLKLLKYYINNQFQVICWFFKSPQTQKLVTIKSLKHFITVAQNTIKEKNIQQSQIQTVLKNQKINIIKLKTILWFFQRIQSKSQKQQLKKCQEQNININNFGYITIFNELQKDENSQKIQKSKAQSTELQKLISNRLNQGKIQVNDKFQFLKQTLSTTDIKQDNWNPSLNKLSDTQVKIIISILLQRLIIKYDINQEQSKEQLSILQIIKNHCVNNKNKAQISTTINKAFHIIESLKQTNSKQN